MIGLTVIALVTLFLVFYFWLIIKVVKFVKRKTGSNWLAGLSVLIVIALTVGDTAFNRWYHKEVLCKRDDVGVKIFSTVKVPPGYWDKANNSPILQDLMIKDENHSEYFKPFLGRYAETRRFNNGGWFPFTMYKRLEVSVVDVTTGTQLGRFVDYNPMGGFWWLFPLRFVNHESAMGWFIPTFLGPGCSEYSTDGAVQMKEMVFNKTEGK